MPPSDIRVRQLPSPNDAQVEGIARVLMDAFLDDPGIQGMLDGLHTNETVYHSFMHMQVLALRHSGEIWVAEDTTELDEGKRIIGLAGWFGPGENFLETEEQREASGVARFFGMLSEELAGWWTSYYIPRTNSFLITWIGETTITDNWFLHALAILPAYQGKGIGHALFQARAESALAQGKRVLWQAGLADKAAMYESWGAVIKGAEVFESLGRKTVSAKWIMELPSRSTAPYHA